MTRTHWQRPLALAAGLACALAPLGASPAHAAPATHLIVNEVFGGGGNAGAPYANDFVAPDPFAASDHDPALVGINTTK